MSSNESYSIHVEESQHTVPQNSCLHEYFYIKLHHFHSNSLNHYFCYIPRNLFGGYDDFESPDPDSFTSTYLRNTFSRVPISSEVLEQTLIVMIDTARYMNSVNIERCNIWGMDVFVRTSSNDGVNFTSMLDKVKLDDITSSKQQCAICLEEFCNESKSEIVRTKCMHDFHEHCIAQWLKQCDITNQFCSCPLCRSQIQ